MSIEGLGLKADSAGCTGEGLVVSRRAVGSLPISSFVVGGLAVGSLVVSRLDVEDTPEPSPTLVEDSRDDRPDCALS